MERGVGEEEPHERAVRRDLRARGLRPAPAEDDGPLHRGEQRRLRLTDLARRSRSRTITASGFSRCLRARSVATAALEVASQARW